MGDTSNIYCFSESTKDYFKNKNYLFAAVDAYWCMKYCSDGEPYGISDIQSFYDSAYKVYRSSIKKLSLPKLSKTQYINGCQCLKYLWLYKNKFNEKIVSDTTRQKFEIGHIIGLLAHHLFPNGKDATPHKGYCDRIIDMSRFYLPTFLRQLLMLENTKSLIDEDIVYEASFVHNSAYAAVDILVKEGERRIAYEVKSAPEISDTFIKDCAFQYYVISNNIKLDDIYIVYLNAEYIKELGCPIQELNETNCDVNKLFVKESVLELVVDLQAEIVENVKRFKEILSTKTEPKIKQGKQCTSPYECAFKNYCYNQEHPIEDDPDFGVW